MLPVPPQARLVHPGRHQTPDCSDREPLEGWGWGRLQLLGELEGLLLSWAIEEL